MIDPDAMVDPDDVTRSRAITLRECSAMRILAADPGWNDAVLAMTFQCNTSTVSDHVDGRCSHRSPVAPPGGWRGKIDPEERRKKAWSQASRSVEQ